VHVLITRPREAATALASELEARGHSTLIEPLRDVGIGRHEVAGIVAVALRRCGQSATLSTIFPGL
jgi:uroporphyrinogen-III synthase